jgi:AraC-like DNA-binding protein
MTWQAKVTPAMRKEMRALWPELTMREIAEKYGLSPRTVWTQLRGVASQRRTMEDQEILDMRAAYPALTLKQIAERWGYSQTAVRDAVSGRSHAHLPGAKETPNRGWAHMVGRPRPAKRKLNVHQTLLLHRL